MGLVKKMSSKPSTPKMIAIIGGIVIIVIALVIFVYTEQKEFQQKQFTNPTLFNETEGPDKYVIEEIEVTREKVLVPVESVPESMTDEKVEGLRNHWAELDAKRAENNRVKAPNYQQDVIKSFESGDLNHIQSCDDLDSWYKLYHGGRDWSRNKEITDYLKVRMSDCDFRELPELKEKIDAERERIANATKIVIEELTQAGYNVTWENEN